MYSNGMSDYFKSITINTGYMPVIEKLYSTNPPL